MIISPIINGLACATFFLFYHLYKYLFLWVYQQGTDTGGLFYPKALRHLFVGLYVEQVCMAVLFFLSQDSNNHGNAVPEGALMIVLIVFTVRRRLLCPSTIYLRLLSYRFSTMSSSTTLAALLRKRCLSRSPIRCTPLR